MCHSECLVDYICVNNDLCCFIAPSLSFFFFNDTATTEIYTLSLHDALPIFGGLVPLPLRVVADCELDAARRATLRFAVRSEEHTSGLQSLAYLVCRLLLEKKKKKKQNR